MTHWDFVISTSFVIGNSAFVIPPGGPPSRLRHNENRSQFRAATHPNMRILHVLLTKI